MGGGGEGAAMSCWETTGGAMLSIARAESARAAWVVELLASAFMALTMLVAFSTAVTVAATLTVQTKGAGGHAAE